MKRSLLIPSLVLLAAAIGSAIWLLQVPDQPDLGGEHSLAPDHRTPAAPAASGPTTTPTAEPTRRDAAARTTAATAASNATEAQGVFGRAVDGNGTPIPGTIVWLMESPNNDPVHHFLGAAQGMPSLAAAAMTTGDDGTFRLGLRAVDTRRHELCLQAVGFAPERLAEISVQPGEWLDLGPVTLFQGTTIHGRITVAGTDLPAPGATVRIESGDPFFDIGPAQIPDWKQRRSAAADADGRYELRDVPRHGIFRLLATAPGFGRQIRDSVELASGQALQIDFALPRGLSIAGQLSTAGEPLGKVRIEVFAKAAEPAFAGTVGNGGRFFVHGLREGPHLVRIDAEGFQPVAIDNVAAGTENLSVTLEARGRASVEVRSPDGAVVLQYRLSVRRSFPDGQIAAVRDVPERVVRLEPGTTVATVDGLDNGNFRFHVEADGYARTLSEQFVLSPTQRHATVAVTLTRGGTLRGIVVDSTGHPVAGAELATEPAGMTMDNPMLAVFANLTPDRITREHLTTDAEGRFELRRLAHADYQLAITHPEYCRTVRTGIVIADDSVQDLGAIALSRGTAVRGRALRAGVPTAQVLVVLTPAPASAGPAEPQQKSRDETSVARVEAVTNADGRFELPRRLPPGNYELRGVLQLSTAATSDPFQRLVSLNKSAVQLVVLPGQEVVETDLHLTDH